MRRSPPRLGARGVAAACATAAALLAPAAASAGGPFDVYGAGARGAAMGNAMVAHADSYDAAYYNLAAMTLAENVVGFGFIGTANNMAIRLADRPAGYDIPDLGESGPAIASNMRLRERSDTDDIGPSMTIYGGAISSLGIENLRLGAVAAIPLVTSGDQQSFFVDEREQYTTNQLHFELFGTRIEHATLIVGGAYAITDWLALGVGVSYMPSTSLQNYVYVDSVVELSDIDLNVGLSVPASFRPNVGLLLTPHESVRVGMAFRERQSLLLEGANEIQVRGLQDGEEFPFSQPIDIRLMSSPRQFVWGLSWETDRTLLALDATYSVWSDYRDTHNAEAGFSDTFSPKVGFEYTLRERHSFRVGGGFEPSPVPEQTGRTSYVDNDRLMLSVGTGHDWVFGESVLSLAWYAQLHGLFERETVKDDSQLADGSYPRCAPGITVVCDEVPDNTINSSTGRPYAVAQGLQTGNPGWPGFSSGGWLASLGLEVSWQF